MPAVVILLLKSCKGISIRDGYDNKELVMPPDEQPHNEDNLVNSENKTNVQFAENISQVKRSPDLSFAKHLHVKEAAGDGDKKGSEDDTAEHSPGYDNLNINDDHYDYDYYDYPSGVDYDSELLRKFVDDKKNIHAIMVEKRRENPLVSMI